MKIQVRSTVIDYVDKTMEITDMAGGKYVIPLDQSIQVTMVGYPDREVKSLPARDLDAYMSRGYIIEQISYKED